MRRVEIILPEELSRKTSGVYIFLVGERFYIGRSISVRTRLLAHTKYINECLENYNTISNGFYLDRNKMRDMYFRIAKYVHEHPKIKHISVVAIYEFNNHINMCVRENKLLRLHENHPDCFNTSFSSSISDRLLPVPKVKKARAKKQPIKPTRPTRAELLRLLKKIRGK